MNLRQIEAFRAVIESGTVSRAAERLSISQPAVTKLLQNLERSTGLALFDRARGRLAPTTEARMLFDEVERLFKGLDNLKNFVEEVRTLRHGSLQIGVMPALSTGFIQDLVADFITDHPLAQISIHARSTLKLVDWLVAGHLDVALTSNPVVHPELTRVPLARRAFVCVLPLDHPLAGRSVIRASDLAGEPFISFSPDSQLRQRIDRLFEEAGIERRLMLEAPMAPTICALVARGLGVSILNPFYIGAFRDLVATRPFAPVVETEISVLMVGHRQRSLAAKAFLDRVQAYVGRHGGRTP